MSIKEKQQKYYELCHAMQTGVAFAMQKDNGDTTPKHLRVGINAAMSDHAALVTLLFRKNIITEDEYWDAMIESMENEVKRYQDILKDLYGGNPNITLA